VSRKVTAKQRRKRVRKQWDRAINDYLTREAAGARAETTMDARRDQLLHLSRNVKAGPFDLTATELRAFVASRPWKRETRRVRRATFKSFYAWALEDGLVEENIGERLPKVRMDQGHPRPAPDWAVREAERKADLRELVMIRLAADMGLRRAEVAQVHYGDIIHSEEGPSLTVHGKGDKDREVPMPEDLMHLIHRWRRNLEHPDGFLFPGKDRGHLSPRFVGRLIAALLPGEYTAHTLRHRFATRLYAETHDLLLVQELLGHTNPNTTRRYVDYGRAAMRAAVYALAKKEKR
jgi:integrase/recombinase XerC